jgi:hypothetical protein
VTILRERHPFEGRSLAVMSAIKRRGTLSLLVVLPDGQPRAHSRQLDGLDGDRRGACAIPA